MAPNVFDEYLKRRGWKEPASVRTYMAALRNSDHERLRSKRHCAGESFGRAISLAAASRC